MWASNTTMTTSISMSCSSTCDPSGVMATAVQPCSSLQLEGSVAQRQVHSLLWDSQQQQVAAQQAAMQQAGAVQQQHQAPPSLSDSKRQQAGVQGQPRANSSVTPWLQQHSSSPTDTWPNTSWAESGVPPTSDHMSSDFTCRPAAATPASATQGQQTTAAWQDGPPFPPPPTSNPTSVSRDLSPRQRKSIRSTSSPQPSPASKASPRPPISLFTGSGSGSKRSPASPTVHQHSPR
ncbi:MAG: hypothetical protein WDW36_001341 [Sanguina aurantia]